MDKGQSSYEQGQSARWKQMHIHFTFIWYSVLKQIMQSLQVVEGRWELHVLLTNTTTGQ